MLSALVGLAMKRCNEDNFEMFFFLFYSNFLMLKVRTRGMDAIKLRIQEVHITHIKSAAPNNDFYFKGVWAKLGAFVPGGGGRFDGGAEAKGYRGPALHCHGQVVQVQK